MSRLFFDPTVGFVPLSDDGEPWSSLLDPTLVRELARDRWEARAAQWRARTLAEEVFDGEVEAHLTGHTTRGPFRGLLHLRVPFHGIARHRDREAVFLAAAARDPVLARVPFLYLIGPGVASCEPAVTP